MFGLVIRSALLLAVVFAVVYGVVSALRKNAHARHAAKIRQEIRQLRAGLEAGLYSQDEYARLANKLRIDCEREGIDIPSLPARLPKPTSTNAPASGRPSDETTSPGNASSDASRKDMNEQA